MKKAIFKFLKNHFSQDPRAVDRLIVSSFIQENNLIVRKNNLLKKYLITQNDHDEYKNLNIFASYFKGHKFKFDFETLVELFEFVISPSDKIVTGAVYTPKQIREAIVDEAFKIHGHSNESLKICDMACGCGGFLYTVAQKLKSITQKSYATIFEKNIYGLDIKDYSITRTKLLLSLLALYEGENIVESRFNLFEGNALEFDWGKTNVDLSGFDVIVGNPPYVCSRNIDEESKKLLSNWSVCSSGHPDLYIPFFQVGLKYLKQAGVLGYITMNTFFKSVNGRALRKYFQESQFQFNIIDFGSEQVFHSKSTYTCICFIQIIKSSSIKYVQINDTATLNSNKTIFKEIPYSSLDSHTGWNLQNVEIINKIESVGTPLGSLFKTSNGIATLKNDIFIFEPIDEDQNYYYLKLDRIYPIEKGICCDIINPNKLTVIDNLNSLKIKIIFPYKYINNKAQILSSNYFRTTYPEAYRYLKSKRDILVKRDKGKGNYEQWYAFGRCQGFEKLKYKLFFPHITHKIPNYVVDSNENLLFYNGITAIGKNKIELLFLKKIMSSRLFWFYITNSSKPYGSGYFSLSRNYIKNFGIYEFSNKEYSYIVVEDDYRKLNRFIESKYDVDLPPITGRTEA